MRKIYHFFLFFIQYCFYYLITPIAYLLYKKKYPWIICERGTDARDNGYAMYKYLKCDKPFVNVYYLISKKSVDLHKFNPLTKIVKYKSFKHWLLYRAAECRMSTHLAAFAPGNYIGEWFKHHRQSGINVFLQHGITHNEFPSNYYEHNGSDLFICGAEAEFKYISKNCHFPEGNVVYTGFSRFDELHNNDTKNQILVMPSWRSYLKGKTKAEFKESEYFKRLDSILRNAIVNQKLNEKKYKLILYIHYSLQQYINCFTNYSDNIIIADFNHYDVQTLLKESKLLITDYSSVFFDFAYMKKPLIYYQFDVDDFYGMHYQRSYFNHMRDGFGEVVNDEEMLTLGIIKLIDNGFELEDKYKERANNFFALHDSDNSKRIFETIIKKRIDNMKLHRINDVTSPKIVLAADDYGRNIEASIGISKALTTGSVKKSSMIVNKYEPSLIDRQLINNHQIGLHINLYDSDINPSHKKEKQELKYLEGICLSPLSYFYIKKSDKALIKKHIINQVYFFKKMSSNKSWDTHGHTHNKYPILRIIIPLVKENGFTNARLAQNMRHNHFIYDLTYKFFINRIIKANFDVCDFFGSVDDLFRTNLSSKRFKNKTIEIMTHPFIDNFGCLTNRRDYSFELIKYYFSKYGIND